MKPLSAYRDAARELSNMEAGVARAARRKAWRAVQALLNSGWPRTGSAVLGVEAHPFVVDAMRRMAEDELARPVYAVASTSDALACVARIARQLVEAGWPAKSAWFTAYDGKLAREAAEQIGRLALEAERAVLVPREVANEIALHLEATIDPDDTGSRARAARRFMELTKEGA